MAFPVLLALVLAGGVAVVVFLGAPRQLSTWLVLLALGLLVAGGLLWAHEPSHRHAPETVAAALEPAVGLTSPYEVAGDYYAEHPPPSPSGTHSATITFIGGDTALPVDTGSGPNHLPAIVVFALGGAAGLVGVVLRRRTRAPAP